MLSLIIQSSQPFNVIIMMLVGSTEHKDGVSYPSYVFCSFSFCYHAINLTLHQRDHIKGSFLCIVMLFSIRQCTLLSFIFICSCSCLITHISTTWLNKYKDVFYLRFLFSQTESSSSYNKNNFKIEYCFSPLPLLKIFNYSGVTGNLTQTR